MASDERIDVAKGLIIVPSSIDSSNEELARSSPAHFELGLTALHVAPLSIT